MIASKIFIRTNSVRECKNDNSNVTGRAPAKTNT